jgi:prepilin-type N-terminal cleavage/methylation domain-containing protein
MKYVITDKNAFTLVELAIVIVIIGLLVGGVLSGQELIKQAKIRAQIKQFQSYDAAIASFRGKYGFLPGDIPGEHARRFKLSTNDGNGGSETTVWPNGDGRINDDQGRVPPIGMWPEPKYFFTQLWQARLIAETIQVVGSSYTIGETFPFDKINNKYSGIAPVSLPDGGLYYFMGVTVNTNSNSLNAIAARASLMPEQAFGLDEKLDDGIPSTGRIRAVITSTSIATHLTNDTNANSCIGADDQQYNLTTDSVTCKIIVRAGV